MKYNSINLPLVLRLIVFFIFSAVAGFAGIQKHWVLMALSLLAVLISMLEMLHFSNSINRKITFFFDAVSNEDSTLHFPENTKNKSQQELHRSLNRLNDLLSEIKIRNEYNERFFRELLKYSSTGIMAIDSVGYVEVINDSALQLFGLSSLSHIDLLKQKNDAFYMHIQQLKPGEPRMIKLQDHHGLKQISVQLASLQFGEKKYRVYSLHDLKSELEENELDSWQKLIRVLTHEIMNSIAPITSLSNTLAKFFRKNGETVHLNELSQRNIDQTLEGLTVIEETGKGLVHFVDNYRQLARIPKPVFRSVQISEWLKHIQLLVNDRLKEKNIQLVIRKNLYLPEFIADEKLLNQVLINLINNAVDAISENKEGIVQMQVQTDANGIVQISVTDNGMGIPPENLDKLFIPFFTTKEHGSGIGLSLSRQIMRLHKGSISVHSVPGKSTVFVLRF